MLDINNIKEGEDIFKKAKQKFSFIEITFGIPSRERGEEKIFRFDIIKEQDTFGSTKGLYAIVGLKKRERYTHLLVPCGIKGRVPSTVLGLFYIVDSNISAIRQLDSHAPTKINLKIEADYQNKEII